MGNMQQKDIEKIREHQDEELDIMSTEEIPSHEETYQNKSKMSAIQLWRIVGIILMIIVILFGLLLIYCMPPYYNMYYTFLNWALPERQRGTV